jgi:hypothetical protein
MSQGAPALPFSDHILNNSHNRQVREQSRTEMAYPEMITAIAHLRDVLGDQTYESLARKGETMTTDEMVTYA